MASGDHPSYPPDINCWRDQDYGFWSPYIFEGYNCSITNNMVNFLNLTGTDYKRYLHAYCVDPRRDDDCPFSFCPNPDIAGPLVRAANYISGFCLAILILYSPRRVKEAYWSQILITYSLLLTCGISLLRKDLTRFHTIILITIVCSPVSVYFTGYAIRASWSTHRLDAVLGKKQYLRRGLVFLSVTIWVAILIYAYLPPRHTDFAQASCRGQSNAEGFFLGVPFVYAWFLAQFPDKGTVLTLALAFTIPALVVVYWIFAIIQKRRDIWPSDKPFRPRFRTVWREVVDGYPFLQFMSVVVVPAVYWISCIEIGLLWENDNTFSLTFGQVIALFASLPPVIQVLKLTPELRHWWTNLPWVLWIKRTWSKRNAGHPTPWGPDRERMPSSNAESIEEKQQVDDNSLNL